MRTPRKRLATQVLQVLRQCYPHAGCSLRFRSPLELLIATMLSAQCTDIQVNKITPALFQQFPTAAAFAAAPLEAIEESIKSSGFFRNKAKNIQAACQMLLQQFDGEVPGSMTDLVSLPGVGRKTANVVLGNAFGRNEGFVVDTHVFRLTHRMGLAEGGTPEKVEQELMALFPQDDWAFLSHALIQLGRGPCKARKPTCSSCPMQKFCAKTGLETG